jgi:hypothetical protein
LAPTPDNDEPYNAEPIELLTTPEAARRRPQMFFGVPREDPALLTRVVRGVILDIAAQASPTERVAIRMVIRDDRTVDIELTYPDGTPPGLDQSDDTTHIPQRYSLAVAASGFTQALDVHVAPALLRLHLQFDPARFTPDAILSHDATAYTDPTGAGPWLDPELLQTITIEDLRR